MHTPPAASRLRSIDWFCLALALALLVALALTSTWLWHESRRPLLLTPTIGRLSDCLEMAPPRAGELEAACLGEQGSAAERIESALRQFGSPQRSPDGHFEMGYTLLVPLLNLFERNASGAWVIDRTATARIARTVQEVQRPMVLYLFSTHFSERAPIEPELAADPANIAHTQHGALPVDSFMGEAMYPWSIARTDNSITQRREQAIAAVLEPLCALPREARARIVGINLLGEVHHLYPSFESGMGADSDYLISDYSPASIEGFRRWLRQRFGTLEALNTHLNGAPSTPFASWDDVRPPARNIHREQLEHFWQHLDDTAAGMLAISGWAHDASLPKGRFPWVRIYVDGVLYARVRASAGRLDVEQALPDVGSRVGWRYDLPFAGLPRGRHRIDVMQEGSGGRLYNMGTRFIAVMGQSLEPVAEAPMRGALPEALPPQAHIRHSLDTPHDGRAVFFNPLAVLWHEWRAQQVVDYLAHFDRVLAASCLADVPRRTQQIFPARRSGWDSSRFASDASLRPFGQVTLGINLYGEPSYGAEFFDWLARSSVQRHYNVTEFHPLRAMSAADMRATLERHRAHGAHTFSFFLDAPAAGDNTASSPFVFSAANPQHHSDTLFSALRGVLQQADTRH